MKRASSLLLPLLLAVLMIACSGPDSSQQPSSSVPSVEAVPVEHLVQSYYQGQESRAYGMLQKSIFQNLLDDWAGEAFANPAFDYDTFSSYQILDEEGAPVEGQGELYQCTFHDEEGRYGFLVVSYEGEGMSQVNTVETPYPFDLQANLKDIVAQLGEDGLDGETADAKRVQLAGEDSTQEAIYISDQAGHLYFCLLGEDGPTVEAA